MNLTLQNHDQHIKPNMVAQMPDTLKEVHGFFQESRDVFGQDDSIDEVINLYLQEAGHWYVENVGEKKPSKKKADKPAYPVEDARQAERAAMERDARKAKKATYKPKSRGKKPVPPKFKKGEKVEEKNTGKVFIVVGRKKRYNSSATKPYEKDANHTYNLIRTDGSFAPGAEETLAKTRKKFEFAEDVSPSTISNIEKRSKVSLSQYLPGDELEVNFPPANANQLYIWLKYEVEEHDGVSLWLLERRKGKSKYKPVYEERKVVAVNKDGFIAIDPRGEQTKLHWYPSELYRFTKFGFELEVGDEAAVRYSYKKPDALPEFEKRGDIPATPIPTSIKRKKQTAKKLTQIESDLTLEKKRLAYKHKSRGRKPAKPSLRKNQKVEVTAGKDKGKVGKIVASIHPEEDVAAVQFVDCEVHEIKLTYLKPTTKALTQPKKKATTSKKRATTRKKRTTTAKKKSTTSKKRTTKKTTTGKKRTTSRKKATTAKKRSTTAKKPTGRPVAATSPEQRVAKRALNLHGKTVTWKQVLNFIKYIQRFANKKEITKTSKHSDTIKDIGNMAINFYAGMEKKKLDKEKFSIPDALRTKLEKIATSERVRPSVSLINSFISMLGSVDFDKMARLVKRIENALEKGRVKRNDPYFSQLEGALKKLRYAIENRKQIDIPATTLSGIQSILEQLGIKTPKKTSAPETVDIDYEDVSSEKKKPKPLKTGQGLSGVDQLRLKKAVEDAQPKTDLAGQNNRTVDFQTYAEPEMRTGIEDEFFVSADKLHKQNVRNVFRLPGEFGKLLGDLERYELAITIEGDEGSKKTRFSYQLADAFLEAGFSVGMFSLEIGERSKLIRDMVNEYLASHNRPKLKVAGRALGIETIHKYADDFDVIIIDSWGKLNVPSQEFDTLRKAFPNTVFVVVFQRTTQGVIRGGTAPLYDAGINMKAVKEPDHTENYVYASKNRYGETGLKYVIDRKTIEGTIYDEPAPTPEPDFEEDEEEIFD